MRENKTKEKYNRVQSIIHNSDIVVLIVEQNHLLKTSKSY